MHQARHRPGHRLLLSCSWPRSSRGRSCPPVTCPATAPATCGSACTCGCTPARASPPSSACGCAGAAWPRCAARAASAPRSRCGTGSCDSRQHSVFLGRAHYRHGLRVPLEEHLLVMAPPRTFKTAFLADVILRYPGPGHRHHHQGRRLRANQRGARPARPGARLQPPRHRRRPLPPSAGPRSPGCQDPATAIRRADAFAFAVSQKGVEDGTLLVRQGQ